MTLDEAIEHAKEVARTCDDKACAAEHAQLAEWLSLLEVYTDTHMAEEVQRARHEMHGWQLEWKREMERREELETENARLREQIHWLERGDVMHVLTDQEYIDQCERERLMQASIDALDTENAKLREELAKWERLAAGIDLPECPVTQFEPKDLERENAKLRNEVSNMYREMQGVLDMSSDTVWVDKFGTLRDHMDTHMESMRDLGIQPPDYDQRMRELGLAEEEE